jgi:hypothetical protein
VRRRPVDRHRLRAGVVHPLHERRVLDAGLQCRDQAVDHRLRRTFRGVDAAPDDDRETRQAGGSPLPPNRAGVDPRQYRSRMRRLAFAALEFDNCGADAA